MNTRRVDVKTQLCEALKFDQDHPQIGIDGSRVYTDPPSVLIEVLGIARSKTGPKPCRHHHGVSAMGSKWSICKIWTSGTNRGQFRMENPKAVSGRQSGSNNAHGWRSQAACPPPMRRVRHTGSHCVTKTMYPELAYKSRWWRMVFRAGGVRSRCEIAATSRVKA